MLTHRILQDQQLINSYRLETKSKLKQVEELSDPEHPRVFHVTRCSSCGGQLDLPSVHFMCDHSYHQRYVQSALQRLFSLATLLTDWIFVVASRTTKQNAPTVLASTESFARSEEIMSASLISTTCSFRRCERMGSLLLRVDLVGGY